MLEYIDSMINLIRTFIIEAFQNDQYFYVSSFLFQVRKMLRNRQIAQRSGIEHCLMLVTELCGYSKQATTDHHHLSSAIYLLAAIDDCLH